MSIEAIVDRILTWQAHSAMGGSPELERLFATLAMAATPDVACEIEDLIWQTWTRHADPDVNTSMDEAIAAIARRDYERAEQILDGIVGEHPNWAEAWNKRATLFFLQGKHAESLRDISRTLELEPRHFGAMAGFAQICLRAHRFDAARLSLQTVLRINPHSESARAILQTLPEGPQPTLH